MALADGHLAAHPPSHLGGVGAGWPNDVSQTPLTAYPHSAITPSTRNAFWADEPRSAITPNKNKSASRRHEAKALSSAWRSGASGGTGKTRGGPPLKKDAHDGPCSAYPTETAPPTFRTMDAEVPQGSPALRTPGS